MTIATDSYCTKSIDGEHDFCPDCCHHGECLDCGLTDPNYDPKLDGCPCAD